MITFTVPGDPKPQGRPRFVRMGKFVRAYDPKTSVDFKSKVAFFGTQSGLKPHDGAVMVSVDLYLKRPKAKCRKSDSPMKLPCSKRPDCDNFAKAIADALTGIAWKDDGQIQTLNVRKWYHEIGLGPRAVIEIKEI